MCRDGQKIRPPGAEGGRGRNTGRPGHRAAPQRAEGKRPFPSGVRAANCRKGRAPSKSSRQHAVWPRGATQAHANRGVQIKCQPSPPLRAPGQAIRRLGAVLWKLPEQGTVHHERNHKTDTETGNEEQERKIKQTETSKGAGVRERPKLRTCSQDQGLQQVSEDQAGSSRGKDDRHR